jgi:hypothetical protein
MKQNITIFAKRIYGQINWFTMKRRLYTSDFYTKSAFRNYALSSSLFSVWYETLIFHSPSVENVKFEVDIEPSRNACEVFKARESRDFGMTALNTSVEPVSTEGEN